MKIKGTGKSEVLNGTSGSDYIEGGAGNDVLYGGVGTDYLIGGRGADTFVFGARSQYDVVMDFNPAEGDRILFDYGGSANRAVYSGTLSDGLSFDTLGGTCSVCCTDFNGDGIMDTQLSMNGDNLFLIGWTPDSLAGWSILGG